MVNNVIVGLASCFLVALMINELRQTISHQSWDRTRMNSFSSGTFLVSVSADEVAFLCIFLSY